MIEPGMSVRHHKMQRFIGTVVRPSKLPGCWIVIWDRVNLLHQNIGKLRTVAQESSLIPINAPPWANLQEVDWKGVMRIVEERFGKHPKITIEAQHEADPPAPIEAAAGPGGYTGV